MLQPLRAHFNARFTPEKYAELQRRQAAIVRTQVGFRVAETPCFFPIAMLRHMAEIGVELTKQLVDSPEYMRLSSGSIPAEYKVPNESRYPEFMTVDFGLVRAPYGTLHPKLVEMQAFPSLFGYQDVLSAEYVHTYNLDTNYRWHLGGHTSATYWELLRNVIVGDHDPRQVVLAEVEPGAQKTRCDFNVYEDRLGIQTVDIATIRKEGRTLLYRNAHGDWVAIRRIFNRAIVDEMRRKGIQLAFDYRDDLDVEWAGHPNWFFRISKFSLPHLHHSSVPQAILLEDWFTRNETSRSSANLGELLLKPLYSFAGKGIQFAPTEAELQAIPAKERSSYLLQERVHFEPVIQTPSGLTQAEIRIMYIWPQGGALQPVISLVRMGRGLMMGVDHNRNQEWTGGSAALFLPESEEQS